MVNFLSIAKLEKINVSSIRNFEIDSQMLNLKCHRWVFIINIFAITSVCVHSIVLMFFRSFYEQCIFQQKVCCCPFSYRNLLLKDYMYMYQKTNKEKEIRNFTLLVPCHIVVFERRKVPNITTLCGNAKLIVVFLCRPVAVSLCHEIKTANILVLDLFLFVCVCVFLFVCFIKVSRCVVIFYNSVSGKILYVSLLCLDVLKTKGTRSFSTD